MGESRHALIIANDSYQDEGLKKLVAPAQDAVALAGVLGDPGIGAFDVDVVRNEPSHVILTRIDDFFSDRRTSDTLVVHFSCHGLKSESGDLYFAASNTKPQRLASTAVAASFVRQRMSSTRARSIALFLDCCYGGAFSQGSASVRASGDVNVLESFSGERLGGGRGWAVITASNSMEYAFEGTALADDSAPRPSVFTSAVVRGLSTGEADLDEDGRISLDELYEYVFDHVREENPNQTPSRTVDMQGGMYLARSHRRRITASPVPENVRAAMRSPDIFTRRGAIMELRSRMENTDLSVAVGAREALEEMARKDIRSVADEARGALSEVRVNPYPTQVDFGPVPQHSPPPHRSVRLLGPPLARSCAPHPKRDWLRAVESSDGVDVRVDTSTPGHLSGDIVLKGVVGEAVLHVDVEVLPTLEAVPSAPTPETQPPPTNGKPPHEGIAADKPTPSEPAPEAPPAHEAEAERHPAREHGAPPKPGTSLKALRAPAVAAVALSLAITSVIMAIQAAVAATEAVQMRVADQWTPLADHVQGTAMMPSLVVSLVTALVGLILIALARHDLGSSDRLYAAQSARATKLFTRTAKLLAIPALVLALAIVIAFLIARRYV
ncbi:caspase family protein [Streptomyces inhibens]|uniref:caspase family protein n=1 Tax=Streptomyces inhibens TaxID=2293571 RepID=UPI00378C2E9F